MYAATKVDDQAPLRRQPADVGEMTLQKLTTRLRALPSMLVILMQAKKYDAAPNVCTRMDSSPRMLMQLACPPTSTNKPKKYD